MTLLISDIQTRTGRGAGAKADPPRALSRLLARAQADWRGPGLEIRFPDGRKASIQGPTSGPPVVLSVHCLGLFRRVLLSGDIGFAEGYIEGEWDTPDLAGLLSVLCDNWERLSRLSTGSPLARLANLAANLLRRNTRQGARRNIYAHYDLGNDFYAAWLDPSMTYSSALYGCEAEGLDAAQRRKYAALAEAIGLRPEHRLLEIGCGWGGFAEYAASEIGCSVVGLTISEAQHAFATERMRRAGLSDKVEIRFQDYREIEGQFDRIVSIEMFEAVGEAYWPAYFDVVRDRLRPGGRAGLQIITIDGRLFESYRRRVDFIQKYIFPGGMLPSEARLKEEVGRAGLAWSEPRRFGRDYARTLAEWDRRFQAAWPRLGGRGFDDRFRRLWRFYLAYCGAGFRTGRTDVLQVVLSRA